MYKTPEAMRGFLGATWLLEAACMPLETALNFLGAREPPGQRRAFLGLLIGT
jgi:hypothetical protein